MCVCLQAYPCACFDLCSCAMVIEKLQEQKPSLVAQAPKQACDWQLLSSSQQHESFHTLLSLSICSCVWSDGEKVHVIWCFSSGIKSLFNLLDSSYPTLNKHRLVLFFKACGTYLTSSVSPWPYPTMATGWHDDQPDWHAVRRAAHTHTTHTHNTHTTPSLIHICHYSYKY